MLKEIKYIIYLSTILFTFFFVIKFYISDKNINLSKKILIQHQKQSHSKFKNLPIVKNDTKNIIEFNREVEIFKNKKERKFWELLK